VNQDPNRAEEQAQRDGMPCLDVVLDAVVVHLPALRMETTIVSELCHTNKLHSAQMEPNSGANLAANRSTARRWIQAEATVISLANILTMLGNCTLHKRKISYSRGCKNIQAVRNSAQNAASVVIAAVPRGIAQKMQYLREPVLAGEHGAQRVGSPGQVEQVAVEDAKSDVRGAALYGPFGLNKIMGMM
jgi:hypothetical protein